MSGLDDDKEMRAAEYALGTLSADERATFEAELARDGVLAASAHAWANRLAPLAQTMPEIAPPADLYLRIERALPATAQPALRAVPTPVGDDLARMRRLLAGWRRIGLVSSALAASLAVALIVTKTAPPAANPQMLAVLSPKGAGAPVLVRVDASARRVIVAAASVAPPTGRSLELWYIGKGQKPLAMGLVDKTSHDQALPASVTPDDIRQAIFAVTVEPPGGAPNGIPTGPIVYSGPVSLD